MNALAARDVRASLHGVSPNRFMVGALVSAHARAGQPALALQAYSQGRTMGVAPDEVSANALIHAFGRAGQAQTAWELYEQGCADGLALATNEVTVSSLLCAFAKTREVARAIEFFRQTEEQWPNKKMPPVCYLLLRDVAANAGDVAAAQQVSQMMRTMRHHRDGGPDLIIGGAGGDATRDEEEVSSQVFKQRRRGMYAFATFSCDSQVFRTENGDAEQYLPETAPERAMIHGAAEELVEQLRTKTSYRYHTNSVLLMRGNETVKAQALTLHAEKKALGALIRRTDDGRSTLRVGVSIRMCKDCHQAFAHASDLLAGKLCATTRTMFTSLKMVFALVVTLGDEYDFHLRSLSYVFAFRVLIEK
eukprot:CAMPEP_0114305690 /NCGR_PEP_ID=MMETSP0059-20121206/16475_1 /TAXON_ID=36894 /ORGANISM="Pyramimonas parkeae, Strain CCMP726" /LENGTH=362 /DNA_ID=CAMNT_0001428913 /DNA_START=45 /DNA_END=1135 /DNA_ORIENTATION=+